MTIEIYTPQSEVPEHIIFYIKEKLMEYYHRDQGIYEVEVVLKNQLISPGNDHICEITLHINSEVLMVRRTADNYLQSVREVLRELSLKIDDFMERQKEPAEQITSTVRV